jgi:hypothetical protein
MRRAEFFGCRGGVALAALALAVQASLPLLLALALHIEAGDALAIESVPAASRIADRVPADTAKPLAPGHHCTCPICQILAAGQSFPLASHPILPLPHAAPNALIALESAPLLPVSLPSSYQARAPPVVG